ncbi:MAG: sodium/proline symporter PutP [Gammaproteobacteria bacterium]|nr:sodium/proline symporter PutP [Gammaproteobacteria bacterium]MCZ6911339.1 sodium/proline symporter PutP [Pseudomonadota bacterium]
MIQTDSTIILTFLLYLVVVLGIGFIAWRRTRNLSDYILGGRSLGSGVAALSAQASDMSGWLLLGLPGYAYLAGFEAGWMLIGLLIGTYLNWRIVAARLRTATEQYGDSLTLPDYFERRFNDHSGVLRIVSAAFILIFFIFYTSAGLVAGGKLFETVFDMPYELAVIIGTVTVVIYTFIGGFLAVSWTDFFQGMLMFLALIIVAVLGLGASGGFTGLSVSMVEQNLHILIPFTDVDGNPLTFIAVISALGWGLGYFGQPHILARFMAIKSAEHVPRARHIAMIWVTIALFAGMMVGLVGIVLVEPPLQSQADSEKVFMVLTTLLLHPVIAGICLAGILAAVMSTADSQLLVASSAISEDFYKGLLKPAKITEEGLLRVGRLAVVGIAIIAMVLALNADNTVLGLVAYAWAGFGAAFGPTIILSLYWKNSNYLGALAGILTGGLTVIIWKQMSGGPGGIFDLYEIVPGVLLSFIAFWSVSVIGGGKEA